MIPLAVCIDLATEDSFYILDGEVLIAMLT